MTDTIKILAQVNPPASALTTVYMCGATFGATISTINICNQDPVNIANFRMSFAVGGAADSVKQYVYWQIPIQPNDTLNMTEGYTMANGDVLRLFVDNANVSIGVFGVELS